MSNFSRKRICLKSLFNLACDMHPYSGARLHLSHLTKPFIDEDGRKYIDPFFVFWIMPDRSGVDQYSIFDDRLSAENLYSRILEHRILPQSREFKRDYQVQCVYAFDSEMMKKSAKYSLPQMKRLVSGVCDEFGIAATSIDYMAAKRGDGVRALARPDNNEVCMHIKKMSIILHEMAHIINSKFRGDVWSDHGPSFVRVYLQLLEKYMHFPILHLEEIVQKMGIDVAKLSDLNDFNLPHFK